MKIYSPVNQIEQTNKQTNRTISKRQGDDNNEDDHDDNDDHEPNEYDDNEEVKTNQL